MALKSDGKIIIGAIPYVSNVSLARYESDGSLDASFGTKGYAGNDESAAALEVRRFQMTCNFLNLRAGDGDRTRDVQLGENGSRLFNQGLLSL